MAINYLYYRDCTEHRQDLEPALRTEEEGVGLTNIVPFLVEDELKAKGGLYFKGEDWTSFVVSDGLLITGQNPASSAAAAVELLQHLA